VFSTSYLGTSLHFREFYACSSLWRIVTLITYFLFCSCMEVEVDIVLASGLHWQPSHATMAVTNANHELALASSLV
jgi:hypothetical protein